MAHARKWMISKQYAYKISKTALNALTVQYAYSLEEEGFGVFSICPGVSFSPENSASAPTVRHTRPPSLSSAL